MWWLLPAALAQSTDIVETTVGAQVTTSRALGASDVDAVFGERVRWGLSEPVRLWADAQFTYDTEQQRFERSRVRQLGFTYDKGVVALQIGRHAVTYGGPRVVDGLQAMVRTGDVTLGAWGGLAPDLFTTRPMLRPGGGPVVAWSSAQAQATLVGEVTATEAGLDRAGALATARWQSGKAFDTSGRVDWQLSDAVGASGLADASWFASWRPHEAFQLDTLADAWSSLRYRNSALLDPTVQRYAQRVQPVLDPLPGAEEALDPTLHGMVGLRPTVTTGPLQTSLLARHRPGPAEEAFTRLQPMVRWQADADGRLELMADANLIQRQAGLSASAGPTALVELLTERSLWLDGSVRAVVGPTYDGPGMYADLFVDWLAPAGFVLMAGAAYEFEPVEELDDVGVTALLRLRHRLRGPPRD